MSEAEKVARRGRQLAGLRPWKKGQSGNPAGKPAGLLSAQTVEVKEAARRLVDDPEYRAALRQRLVAGVAMPIEALIWHYAYGKPRETIDITDRHAFMVLGGQVIESDPLGELPPARKSLAHPGQDTTILEPA